MPLVRDFNIGSDGRLCLWQITETEEELQSLVSVDLSHIHAPARRRETLAVYAMLRQVTGRGDLVIGHDPSGRPTIADGCISISHTRGWVSLVLSKEQRVAVDVEYFADRVLRITDKFVRPDEQKESLERQLVCWCAKETVYKYFSEENLQYFEMRLLPYTLDRVGRMEVENLKDNNKLWVNYEIHPEYVLAYAVEDFVAQCPPR